MKWNWQQPDWPAFRWNAETVGQAEAQFLRASGVEIGSIRHVSDEARTNLIVDLMTLEAVDTSAIEGELLSRDSVQSSLLSNFGLKNDNRRVPPAERGIADMMVDLYRSFEVPLSHDMLHNWHRMLLPGCVDLRDIGRYRRQGDPMQVVSGYVHEPRVHFEAPPAAAVAREMDDFIAWFVDSSPGGAKPLPPLVRAGLAHLYFVSVHPYEDGNGLIARALAVKALAEATGQPNLLALSHIIYRRRADYYAALEANNKGLEVTPWLAYFSGTVLAAQDYSQRLIDFLIAKTRLYDRVRGRLNDRQARAIARMFREGPEGFTGGLSAANYISITDAPRATATRDLADLVALGVLTVTGTLKSTRYHLNVADSTERSA